MGDIPTPGGVVASLRYGCVILPEPIGYMCVSTYKEKQKFLRLLEAKIDLNWKAL